MRIVTPTSEEDFARYFDLRWRVLRSPWGQPRGSEQDELENRSWHFMICIDDRIPVGVARLHLNSPEQAQIRFMAVEPAWRRKGVGSELIRAIEAQAYELSVTEIVLHAREDTVGFYRSMGYEVTGAGHVLFGTITHAIMRKAIR